MALDSGQPRGHTACNAMLLKGVSAPTRINTSGGLLGLVVYEVLYHRWAEHGPGVLNAAPRRCSLSLTGPSRQGLGCTTLPRPTYMGPPSRGNIDAARDYAPLFPGGGHCWGGGTNTREPVPRRRGGPVGAGQHPRVLGLPHPAPRPLWSAP